MSLVAWIDLDRTNAIARRLDHSMHGKWYKCSRYQDSFPAPLLPTGSARSQIPGMTRPARTKPGCACLLVMPGESIHTETIFLYISNGANISHQSWHPLPFPKSCVYQVRLQLSSPAAAETIVPLCHDCQLLLFKTGHMNFCFGFATDGWS